MSQKGFTLIELTIVMCLLLVFTLLVIPRLNHSNSVNLKNYQREFAYHLQLAHELSMYNQKKLIVQFYQNRYAIRTSALEKPIFMIDYPEGVTVSTNFPYYEVIFNEYGIPNQGGTIYIRSSNTTKRITIIPGTGVVKYYSDE